MNVIELHEYDGSGTAFAVVNEEVATWEHVLRNVTGVKKAASICSGGEIAFFNILPKVEESLECIDHSLGSMYYALGKYHIIEKLGAKRAHELFQAHPDWDYRMATPREGGDWQRLQELLAEGNGKAPTSRLLSERLRRGSIPSCEGLRKTYQSITLEDIKRFRANRTKITFIHGDLNDLVDRGPFDLIYLSNALDYTGTIAGRNKGERKIIEAVKEGGYIALSGGRGKRMHKSLADRVVLETATEKDRAGDRPANVGYPYHWTYWLLENRRDPNYVDPPKLSCRHTTGDYCSYYGGLTSSCIHYYGRP